MSRFSSFFLILSSAVGLSVGLGVSQVSASVSGSASVEVSGTFEEIPGVPNASFENVNADGTAAEWTFYSQKVYSVDESVSSSGKRSLRWQNTDENFYALSKAVLSGMPAGSGARVSVNIKTQDVTGNGGAFCVEYWDSDEKYLSGDYFSGASGTSDWHRVAILCEVPENCAKATICCFGSSGATGTVWFDDIQIERVRLSSIEAVTTDCYRNQTAGGPLKVYVGRKNGEFPEAIRTQCRLDVLDASGKLIVSDPEAAWKEDSPETLVFDVDTKPLKPGEYMLKVTVPRTDSDEPDVETLPMTRFEKMPERKAWIDAHQRLILDGKPFFPMGLYTLDLTDEDIARLADSPFNCVISYHRLSRETMDKMYANGIRTIYSTRFWRERPDEGIAGAVKQIGSLKDHPGILAWYVFDEAPLSFLPNLKRHQDAVRNADPSRPTIAVTDQPQQIRGLLPSYDVIGTDPYPITRPWDLTLKPGQAYEWTKATHEAVWGTRALWQVPQLFNWGIYNKLDIPPETFRRPTFDEMRAMVWMCIAGGGNGIVGYSFFDIVHRDPPYPVRSAEENKTEREKHWAEVVKVMREVERRVPILLSIEKPMEIMPEENSSKAIVHRLYAFEGKTWLLLVNTTEETQKCTFCSSEGKTLSILNPEELKEAGVSVRGNVLSAELPPLMPVFIQLDSAE